MEAVIMIIMAMAALSFLLKLTCHGWPGRIALGLVAALFVIATCEAATEQSKTQIADWLNQPALMLDTSVLLTVDVAFQIGFCLLAAKAMAGTLCKRERVALAITLWVPGLLIFPVLFALLTELVFTLTGSDFQLIAWGLAVGVAIAAPLLASGLRWLIPEPDIRLEMLFMVNLIIAALGIVATVNGRTAATGTNSVEWSALAAVLALLALGMAGGLIYNRFVIRKKITRLQ